MLPDETGTVLLNTGLNETNEVSLTWTADNFKDLSQLRVVAFVQNTATKEVYQAEISAPEISTGLATPAEKVMYCLTCFQILRLIILRYDCTIQMRLPE